MFPLCFSKKAFSVQSQIVIRMCFFQPPSLCKGLVQVGVQQRKTERQPLTRHTKDAVDVVRRFSTFQCLDCLDCQKSDPAKLPWSRGCFSMIAKVCSDVPNSHIKLPYAQNLLVLHIWIQLGINHICIHLPLTYHHQLAFRVKRVSDLK